MLVKWSGGSGAGDGERQRGKEKNNPRKREGLQNSTNRKGEDCKNRILSYI